MPLDLGDPPADIAAWKAAKVASHDAWEDFNDMTKATEAAHDAWVDAAMAESDARDALEAAEVTGDDVAVAREASSEAAAEDAAGDARAASTAAWNDVIKAIADGDPDALADALDASAAADAAAGGTGYDQEYLIQDVSGGFEEVGEDIWSDDGF